MIYLVWKLFCKLYQLETTSFSLCTSQIVCQVLPLWQRQWLDQHTLSFSHTIIHITWDNDIFPCVKGTCISLISSVPLCYNQRTNFRLKDLSDRLHAFKLYLLLHHNILSPNAIKLIFLFSLDMIISIT